MDTNTDINNYNSETADNAINITNDTYLEYNEGYVHSSKDRKQRTSPRTSKHHSEKNFESQNYYCNR